MKTKYILDPLAFKDEEIIHDLCAYLQITKSVTISNLVLYF